MEAALGLTVIASPGLNPSGTRRPLMVGFLSCTNLRLWIPPTTNTQDQLVEKASYRSDQAHLP